jgi:polar amino acid transport system substrate-binding protein
MKKTVVGTSILLIALLVTSTLFAYTEEQASRGKTLFEANCSVCHGADARGGVVPEKFGKLAGQKAPPLAGPGALPGMENAAQVYQFAKTNMPANNPGSLKPNEYLDIVAFALQANGIPPDNHPLTPESAKKIKLSGSKKE